MLPQEQKLLAEGMIKGLQLGLVRGALRAMRCSWRAFRRADQPSQRLSRAPLGDAGRHDPGCDPEVQEGQLLPVVPGAAAHLRKGAGCCHPGSVRAGHLHVATGCFGVAACRNESSLVAPPTSLRLVIRVKSKT